MKSYTDLEQSKKLAEILPLESADMYYCYGMNIHTKGWSFDETPTIIDNSNQIDIHTDIPCWSLAALLNVIPYTIHKSDNEFYRLGIDKGYNDYAVWYNNNGFTITDLDVASDNFVDACCEMIIKLYEQKLL